MTVTAPTVTPLDISKGIPPRPHVPQESEKNRSPRSLFGNFVKARSHGIALGAHRGMGKNVIDDEAMRCGWRENTIKSFLKAAEHGASFIEFDVQVTKDGVPVVWHDDFITYGKGENPFSARICDLTVDEFRSIGHRHVQGILQEINTIYRSNGNSTKQWKCEGEDELPSLEQVFREMPSHVGFNIEIKIKDDATITSTPIEDIEFITKAVLSVVNLFQKRKIVFSSFDPDVVRILKHVQSHTTMFLSEGEPEMHIDPRRTSFVAAIEWASVNGLDGVVLHSNVLRTQLDIISEASSRGLIVMTYGTDNDDHEWVLSQFCLGVHGAIVDDVAGVTQKLSKGDF